MRAHAHQCVRSVVCPHLVRRCEAPQAAVKVLACWQMILQAAYSVSYRFTL